jgi:endoglucanase
MKFQKLPIFLTLLTLFTSINLQAQGYLHASGRYIYDGSGNEVILRGIGTGNWMIQEGYMMQTSDVAGTQHEFRAKLVSTIGEEKTDSFYTVWLDSHFRRIDADSMKSWGFNSVRVAMHYKWFTPPVEEELVPGEITWLNKGFTMIDSLLDWCGDNQMYLILDLHGAPGGQGKESNISDYDPSKPSLWESQANKNKTIALWRKLALRYSNEPWIGGYDLINETNWTFPEGNNSQLWTLLANITKAIREVDQNHIIFYEGNWFANDYTGLTLPVDNNIVLSFHKYWDNPTQSSFNSALNLRSNYDRPIWLGESGENSNVWFTNAIALCEKNHIGWSWWPVKKVGTNNPLKVTANIDYTQLVNYWKGSATKPTSDDAFNAVLQFALNHRLENCSFQKDVIDAMFRQTKTTETIPFTLFHTGEPVFAVDYNLGRNGYAYFDNDTADAGGAETIWNQGYSYRNDGVDIQDCTDADAKNGFNVGWTESGEWMEYTMVVDSTASYTLSIRSASLSAGSKVHLEEDQVPVSPVITLAATGGWQIWNTTEVTGVILTKGTHKIKFVFDQGGSNLNYFKFSNPVPVSGLAFKNLYAVSSADGNFILLTLNKPVTSPIGYISLSDFMITSNNYPVAVTSINLSENNPNIIVINLADALYYGGSIKISYQGTSIQSSSQQLPQFSNAFVANRLPIRFTIPRKIQAEDFSFNKGMESETCTDTDGGIDMGYAHAGDYLDYRVYVPQSKYYTFNFRVASDVSGTQLIIQKGEGTSFTPLDTLLIASTGGWQAWKTLPLTFFLEEGRYTIRLYVKQGQFNINWFQVVSASGVVLNTEKSNDFRIYPNPAGDFVMVDLGGISLGEPEISIYNALGQAVKNIKSVEASNVQIGTADLGRGLYYVVVRSDNSLISTSKLFIL